MTIMNGRIRAELTDLLADHLKLRIGGFLDWTLISEEAMDFIYGDENGDVPQPECETHQEAGVRRDAQRDPGSASCCDGFTCRCCPGSVDRLEGGPITRGDVVYGVMTQEPLRAAFVYLSHPSQTEEFVRLPRLGFGQTPPSPQGSGSAGE